MLSRRAGLFAVAIGLIAVAGAAHAHSMRPSAWV